MRISKAREQKKSSAQKTESYKCNKCKDTTWIQDKNGVIISRCECYAKDKLKKLWEKSGIKDLNASFKGFERWNAASDRLYCVALDYYKKFDSIRNNMDNSALFVGQPGSGKTYISLALANNFINNKSISVLYMPYRDCITRLKQNIVNKEDYESSLKKYQEAEVLLIDDLYKGKITETDINIMFEIVNYRYLNNLPMIISSEHSIEKLLCIDEAIASRIYQMSKSHVAQIENDFSNNYRMKV